MKGRILLYLIAIFGFLVALNTAESSAQIADEKAFAEGSNEFALALYGQLRQQPGNLFYSPFSIRTALAMPYAGAKGETASQMAKVLRFPSSETALHGAASTLMNRLITGGSGRYELAIANSLWGQEGAPLQKEFLDLVARHYAGAVNRADFRNAATRATINSWVEDKTKQKIRDLILPGSVNADTRMVLVNAIHFKGTWINQFPKAATRDASFQLASGKKVPVAMMRNTFVDNIDYMQTKDYQAVELPYRGNASSSFSMLILLPTRKNGLAQLENMLTMRMLDDCVSRLSYNIVDVFLPRFKISWGTKDVQDQLRALGMPQAFSPAQADFSGINGRKPPEEDALFVSGVLHKAYVNVQEEGTEAAAATAVPMAAAIGAMPKKLVIPVFRADHPFLFAIRDVTSGAVLFIGRVTDPTK